MVWDLVLLDNSRLRWLQSKLMSKWTGPSLITQLFPHGVVYIENKKGVRYNVNAQQNKTLFLSY